MGILNLLKIIVPIAKDSKSIFGIVAVIAIFGQLVVGYVDERYQTAIQKINETNLYVIQLKEREYQTYMMAQSMNHNVEKLLEKNRVIDQRIWEMYNISRSNRDIEKTLDQGEIK